MVYPQNKITELEKEIQKLKKVQDNCDHNWGKIIYDPVFITIEYIVTGCFEYRQDAYHPKIESKQEEKPRWKKTCSVCGKINHTEKFLEVHLKKQIPEFEENHSIKS